MTKYYSGAGSGYDGCVDEIIASMHIFPSKPVFFAPHKPHKSVLLYDILIISCY